MNTIKLGPDIRLEHAAEYTRAIHDPAMRPPPEIAAKFPAAAENLRAGPEGVWLATVEELVLVKEGSRKVKRPRHRIHWLDPNGALRVANGLPVFLGIAFGEGVAYLTADRGELLVLSLESLDFSPLPLTGFSYSSEARIWEIFLLQNDRVVLRESLSKRALLARCSPAGLEYVADFEFGGTFTVINRRFLVGGAKSVSVIDLATDTPQLIATTNEVGVGMIWRMGAEARIYSNPSGAWRILAS